MSILMADDNIRIFSPVEGLFLKVEFINVDEELVERIRKWEHSYKPSQNLLVKYRRKMIQTITKFAIMGFPGHVTAGVLDYFSNSKHLDQFEKICDEKLVQNGWLNILGYEFHFIRDNKTLSKALMEEYMDKIRTHLGLIQGKSVVKRKSV
jgi:hypothetical protein